MSEDTNDRLVLIETRMATLEATLGAMVDQFSASVKALNMNMSGLAESNGTFRPAVSALDERLGEVERRIMSIAHVLTQTGETITGIEETTLESQQFVASGLAQLGAVVNGMRSTLIDKGVLDRAEAEGL